MKLKELFNKYNDFIQLSWAYFSIPIFIILMYSGSYHRFFFILGLWYFVFLVYYKILTDYKPKKIETFI